MFYYSKWIDVCKLLYKPDDEVIIKLNSFPPGLVPIGTVYDNVHLIVPFIENLKEIGINYVFISPHYSQVMVW